MFSGAGRKSLSRKNFGSLYKQARGYDQSKLGLTEGFNLLDYAKLKG